MQDTTPDLSGTFEYEVSELLYVNPFASQRHYLLFGWYTLYYLLVVRI